MRRTTQHRRPVRARAGGLLSRKLVIVTLRKCLINFEFRSIPYKNSKLNSRPLASQPGGSEQSSDTRVCASPVWITQDHQASLSINAIRQAKHFAKPSFSQTCQSVRTKGTTGRPSRAPKSSARCLCSLPKADRSRKSSALHGRQNIPQASEAACLQVVSQWNGNWRCFVAIMIDHSPAWPAFFPGIPWYSRMPSTSSLSFF
eukprot:COSAG06_NODE_2506_length_6750_cov_2.437227_1_plen_201_part_10